MFRASRAALARVGSKTEKVKRKPKGLFAPGHDDMGVASVQEKRVLEMLRPMPRPPPLSSSEQARLYDLMVRYGKYRRSIHLIHRKRQNELERAKAWALDALPNYRRIEAVSKDPDPFPPDRPLFTHTPPIPGFNAADLTR